MDPPLYRGPCREPNGPSCRLTPIDARDGEMKSRVKSRESSRPNSELSTLDARLRLGRSRAEQNERERASYTDEGSYERASGSRGRAEGGGPGRAVCLGRLTGPGVLRRTRAAAGPAASA